MRTCVRCPNPLHKSGNESDKQFSLRKYCNRSCAEAARRERMAIFKDTQDHQLKRKAEIMGGNVCISNAVLNAEKVRLMRELNKLYGFTAREISELYGYKLSCIQRALSRITWSHVK